MRVTGLQVRRAWEAYYNREVPGDLPYDKMGDQLIKAMGLKAAQAYVAAQSNDVNHQTPFETIRAARYATGN